MRKLVITADDFGLNRYLDRGIEQTCEEGAVTNVSVMANGEGMDEAARFLTNHPRISVGIHLNLTDGNPLSEANALGNLLDSEGRFLGLHRKAAVAIVSKPSLKRAIEKEFRVQVERALQLGLRPAQLNCHGHLQGIPAIFGLLLEIAVEYKIPFVRMVKERLSSRLFFYSPKRWLKAVGLTLSFRVAEELSRDSTQVSIKPCQGIFDSGRLGRERLGEILRNLPEGLSEIVCHPGRASDSLRKQYPWDYEWDRETELMISPWLKTKLSQLSIQPINFSDAANQ